MLRAAKCPKEYIDAAKVFRCDVCEQTKPKPPTHKVSKPQRSYEFGKEVGIDVFTIKDDEGTHYDILNCVCMGTTYQQAWIVRVDSIKGVPSSSACFLERSLPYSPLLCERSN